MDRTVEIYGKTVNASKGFDLMRGKTLVEHFDTYEQAYRAYKAQGCGYIRYYLADKAETFIPKPTTFKAPRITKVEKGDCDD